MPSRTELLQDRICESLKLIGTHPDYTRRCVNRYAFWLKQMIGRRIRTPNTLAGFLRSSPATTNTGLASANELLSTLFPNMLRESRRPGPLDWTARVFGAVLARSGESHLATRRQITLEAYELASHIEQIAPVRQRAIESLMMLALGPDRTAAVAALAELRQLLGQPYGLFGRQVSEEEVTAWLPEALRAVDLFGEVVSTAGETRSPTLPGAAFGSTAGKTGQRSARQSRLCLKSQAAHPQEAFFDLLLGMPSEGDRRDWEAQRARASECAATQAVALWERYAEPTSLLAWVVEAGESVGAVARSMSRT